MLKFFEDRQTDRPTRLGIDASCQSIKIQIKTGKLALSTDENIAWRSPGIPSGMQVWESTSQQNIGLGKVKI